MTDKEKQRLWKKKYRGTHREKIREYQRKYYEDHREQLLQKDRERYRAKRRQKAEKNEYKATRSAVEDSFAKPWARGIFENMAYAVLPDDPRWANSEVHVVHHKPRVKYTEMKQMNSEAFWRIWRKHERARNTE